MTSRLHRYRALANTLAAALRAGSYPPGTRLPAVRQLCAEHRASLATVTRALHDLEDEGLIEARPRRGFFSRQAVAAPTASGRSTAPAVELEGRRKRLMALATPAPGCLSLGHLALPPQLLPLAALRRLVAQALHTEPACLATGSVFGSAALREQLAKRSQRMGCAFDPEDIVVTHGESESLQLCLNLLAAPGDVIAVARPAPLRALELIASSGLQALEIPGPAGGGLSAAALGRALQQHRIVACVADAGGGRAAGAEPSSAEQLSLASVLARHRLPMIECDMMGELHAGAYRPRPTKAFDAEDWVLYCGSFACITGPGFSLGHVVSGRHRLQLRAARAVHGELVPAMTDRVLAAFVAEEGFDRHLRQLRRRLAAQVEAHRSAVLQHFPAGTRVSTGASGYALWVEMPRRVNALTLLERARARGYTFVPGAVFTTGGQLDHCLRLTATQPLDANRGLGIRTLGEIACGLA